MIKRPDERPGSEPRLTTGRTNQSVGARGEELAVEHLRSDGLQIIDRNWRCRWGEIDIVAAETVRGRNTLVFCEVKTRSGLGYGSPLESITFAKMQRLRRLAGHWLTEQRGRSQRGMRSAEIRIDAIGIVLAGSEPEINHVRAAG